MGHIVRQARLHVALDPAVANLLEELWLIRVFCRVERAVGLGLLLVILVARTLLPAAKARKEPLLEVFDLLDAFGRGIAQGSRK